MLEGNELISSVADTITLSFECTPKYPDEPPVIEIVEQSDTIDDADGEELLQKLNDEASQSLGMVMVFTLVSSAIEWLNALKENADEKQRLAIERKKKAEEEAEQKKFEGTRVTVESFMRWKLAFEKEMATLKEANKDQDISGKLTGKQLFERDAGLVDSDLKFMEEGDVAADIAYDGVKVDSSLFEDLDIEDELDDEEGDE